MKRDLDLCIRILRFAEEHCTLNREYKPYCFSSEDLKRFAVTPEVLMYHCMLLEDAEFIKAHVDFNFLGISRLTWKGHEYLAKMAQVQDN